MDKELCKKCVCFQFSEEHINSVCEMCYQIENIGNGSNAYFIEKIRHQNSCGNCRHCIISSTDIFANNKPYCDASQTFDKDERKIIMQCIRKNYLTKGTPKWCPMK